MATTGAGPTTVGVVTGVGIAGPGVTLTIAGAGDGTVLGDIAVGAGVGILAGVGTLAGAGLDMAGDGVTHTTAGAGTDITEEIMHTCRAEEDIHEFLEPLCAQEIVTPVILEEIAVAPIQQ